MCCYIKGRRFSKIMYTTLLTKNKPSETDCDDSRCQVCIESGVEFVRVLQTSLELFDFDRISAISSDLPFPPRQIACVREKYQQRKQPPNILSVSSINQQSASFRVILVLNHNHCCELELTFFDFSHGLFARVLLAHPTLQCWVFSNSGGGQIV